MTNEQYTRAIEIYNRLRDLKNIKDDLRPSRGNKLTFVSKDDGRELNPYHFRNISEILDKHDLMIRAEIDAEIENLEKEIEKL